MSTFKNTDKNVSRINMIDTFFQDNGFLPKVKGWEFDIQTLSYYQPDVDTDSEYTNINPLSSYILTATNKEDSSKELVFIKDSGNYMLGNFSLLVSLSDKLVEITDIDFETGTVVVETAVAEWVEYSLSLHNARLTKDIKTGTLVVKTKGKNVAKEAHTEAHDKAMDLIETFYGNPFLDVDGLEAVEVSEQYNGKRVIGLDSVGNKVYGLFLYKNDGSTVLVKDREVAVSEVYLLP